MTKREQKTSEFFLSKLKALASMPQCLKSIFDCSVLSKGCAVTYISESFSRDSSISYKALPKMVATCAANIQRRIGVGNGKDKVIIKLSNYNHWIEIFWGAVAAGYVPVLLANNLGNSFVNEIYKTLSVKLIITNSQKDIVGERLSSDECVARNDREYRSVWADEVILLSSGTDGSPKMVTYDGAALCKQIMAARALPSRTTSIMYPDNYGRINILGWLPFSHVFGFVAVFLWYTFFGKSIVVSERMDIDAISTVCVKRAITHVYAVPQFWNILANRFERLYVKCDEKGRQVIDQVQVANLKAQGLAVRNCSALKKIKNELIGNKIKYCISGGSDLSLETARTINSIGYPLHNGYGMTETGVTAVDASNSSMVRTQCRIGFPLAGVEYKLDDDGELTIYSAYLPKEILPIGGEKIDDIQFIKSGDILEFDPQDGYIVVGRSKQIVVTDGGEKLIPSEIKHAYGNIPYSRDTMVECKVKDGVIDIILHIFVDGSLDDSKLSKIYSYLYKIGGCLSPIKRATSLVIHKENNQVDSVSIKENPLDPSSSAQSLNERNSGNKAYDAKLMNTASKIREIIAEVIGVDQEKVMPKSHLIYDIGITSMQFFEIILNIENEYKIHFSPDVYNSCSTVLELVFKTMEYI